VTEHFFYLPSTCAGCVQRRPQKKGDDSFGKILKDYLSMLWQNNEIISFYISLNGQ